MITTTGKDLLRLLKKAEIDKGVTIYGEVFDKKELREALKNGLCHYAQTKRYYGFHRLSRDKWKVDSENWEAKQPRTWVSRNVAGVVIGGIFFGPREAEYKIKQALKECNRWRETTTINGEPFTAKELRFAIRNKLWEHPQTAKHHYFAEDWQAPKYVYPDWEAMQPQTWLSKPTTGVKIGSEFLCPEEAEKCIRKALSSKNKPLLNVLGVTIPYEPFKDLCDIFKDSEIVLSNGTSTQIVFEVPKHRNKSTILATKYEGNEAIININ